MGGKRLGGNKKEVWGNYTFRKKLGKNWDPKLCTTGRCRFVNREKAGGNSTEEKSTRSMKGE